MQNYFDYVNILGEQLCETMHPIVISLVLAGDVCEIFFCSAQELRTKQVLVVGMRIVFGQNRILISGWQVGQLVGLLLLCLRVHFAERDAEAVRSLECQAILNITIQFINCRSVTIQRLRVQDGTQVYKMSTQTEVGIFGVNR